MVVHAFLLPIGVAKQVQKPLQNSKKIKNRFGVTRFYCLRELFTPHSKQYEKFFGDPAEN
jgi:hypothetical protein